MHVVIPPVVAGPCNPVGLVGELVDRGLCQYDVPMRRFRLLGEYESAHRVDVGKQVERVGRPETAGEAHGRSGVGIVGQEVV